MSVLLSILGPLVGALLLFVLPLLAGCGGGGGSGPGALPVVPTPAPVVQPEPVRAVRIAFLGDSLTAGYDSDGVRAHPVERIRDRLGVPMEPENLAISGTAAQQFFEALAPLPGVTFEQWIARTDAQLLVIRYGGIEALYDPTHDLMKGFGGHIERMVALAQARGIALVLVGRIAIPENEMADAAFQQRYSAADATLRDISARMGVPFIDLSGVPVYEGEMHDAIHPGKAYQDRASDVIAAQLAALLPTLQGAK